jgi:hypothetical protein
MADDFGAFESDPTADFLAREQAMLGDVLELVINNSKYFEL